VTPADTDWWICGFVAGIADMSRRLASGADNTGVREVARNAGITIERARAAGVEEYDLRELRKAGVRRGRKAR
jgi:hypothetical protein